MRDSVLGLRIETTAQVDMPRGQRLLLKLLGCLSGSKRVSDCPRNGIPDRPIRINSEDRYAEWVAAKRRTGAAVKHRPHSLKRRVDEREFCEGYLLGLLAER